MLQVISYSSRSSQGDGRCHLIGLGLLALVALLTPVVAPLILSLVSAVALIVVAAWETRFGPRVTLRPEALRFYFADYSAAKLDAPSAFTSCKTVKPSNSG